MWFQTQTPKRNLVCGMIQTPGPYPDSNLQSVKVRSAYSNRAADITLSSTCTQADYMTFSSSHARGICVYHLADLVTFRAQNVR